MSQCPLLASQVFILVLSRQVCDDTPRNTDTGGGGLPDRARPLVMRGHPEERLVLAQSREAAACVWEEGQSFRERERKKEMAVSRVPIFHRIFLFICSFLLSKRGGIK